MNKENENFVHAIINLLALTVSSIALIISVGIFIFSPNIATFLPVIYLLLWIIIFSQLSFKYIKSIPKENEKLDKTK